MKYLKFEFKDRADMLTKLADYHETVEGNFNWKDCAVYEHGYLVKAEGTYDEEGVEITAPVYETKYLVDVLFHGDVPDLAEERKVDSGGKKIKVKKPINEKEFEIIEIDGVGVHTISGLEYLYDERRKEKYD